MVGFDLNLIALGVIYNFPHPLPGQFHFIQLELLRLKHLTKSFGEEQSLRYQRLLVAQIEQYGELKIHGWCYKQNTVL